MTPQCRINHLLVYSIFLSPNNDYSSWEWQKRSMNISPISVQRNLFFPLRGSRVQSIQLVKQGYYDLGWWITVSCWSKVLYLWLICGNRFYNPLTSCMRILDQMERNNDGSMYEITFPELQSEQITSPPNRGELMLVEMKHWCLLPLCLFFDTSNTSK